MALIGEKQTYVFGPVPSRRLGRSLGIDLVPYKTCSFDCIYCQLGRTTHKTIARNNYVPLSEVLDQLWRKLDEGERPDYITLSGSGEPTLHSEIGTLIRVIKQRSRIPVAVLTNGSLLWDEGARDDLSGADVVIPSLDAGEEGLFQKINRPHKKLQHEKIVDGFVHFRKVYSGRIWLEVFLVDGLNTTRAALEAIKKQAERISPDRLDLNTVVRPPAEEYALRVPDSEMRRIRDFFGNAEVIAPYRRPADLPQTRRIKEDLMALLSRRPCTLSDISNGLGMNPAEALKRLQEMQEQGLLRQTLRDGLLYYHVKSSM